MRLFTIPNGIAATDKERTNLSAPGGISGAGLGLFDLKLSPTTDPIDPGDYPGGTKRQRSRAGASTDIGSGRAVGPSAL